MDLEPFRQIIRDRCQLAFKPDSLQHLEEAVHGRMRATNQMDPELYLKWLQTDPQETDHLINLITNNETYFLREEGHYRLLTEHLFPRFLKKHRGEQKPIKIISAGCSSGEEPYSLLISLIETFGEAILPQVELYGLDIDDEALHRARLAVYGPHSFRGVPKEIQDRYFGDFMGNRFVLNEKIQQRVHFIRHNLVDFPYPTETHYADLVFYRNVSIYYQPETQRKIFQNLAHLLAPHGVLVMSSVETSQHDLGIMNLVRENDLFHFTREPAETASLPKTTVKTESPPTQNPDATLKKKPEATKTPPPSQSNVLLEEALSLASKKAYDAALDKTDRVIQAQPYCQEASNLKAGMLLHLNRTQEAEAVCHDSLKRDEWSLEPYLLLGLASEQRQQPDQAVNQFKKAVYLEPSCWLAHFHLANCHSATGHAQDALREYNVTLTLLKQSGLENHGLTFFPFNYSAEQMIQVCQDHVLRLSEAKH